MFVKVFRMGTNRGFGNMNLPDKNKSKLFQVHLDMPFFLGVFLLFFEIFYQDLWGM